MWKLIGSFSMLSEQVTSQCSWYGLFLVDVREYSVPNCVIFVFIKYCYAGLYENVFGYFYFNIGYNDSLCDIFCHKIVLAVGQH